LFKIRTQYGDDDRKTDSQVGKTVRERRIMYADEKLSEALYFLLQMRQSYVDRKLFIYNMNAFLNSARNVTFMLQEEFAHDSKFKAWYPKKQMEMKEDKLMNFFNELRVISVHRKGSPKHSLSVKAAYIFPKDGKMFKASTVGYVKRKYSNEDKAELKALGLVVPSESGGVKIAEPVYTLVTDWEFEEAPEGYEGKDILVLSIEHYHKLKKLVEEAQTVLLKKE
jgi:hypothetical protein